MGVGDGFTQISITPPTFKLELFFSPCDWEDNSSYSRIINFAPHVSGFRGLFCILFSDSEEQNLFVYSRIRNHQSIVCQKTIDILTVITIAY